SAEMDSGLLVENKIEDGQRSIRQLVDDQFPVAVAFWVKTSEEGLWYLYIASAAVDTQKANEAYRIVYGALDKIPGCSILPYEIRLLNSADPIAGDAIALRDRYPIRKPTRYHGQRLGSLMAEEVFFYPRPSPWEVRGLPDGTWQVRISELDDVWLTCESEEDAQAIALAPALKHEALERLKSGDDFAAELERTAAVMEKYHMGFGSRFLRRRAQEVRDRELHRIAGA
ncbi:MAG TPA: hypothetical protein VML55_26445, partial [Planctomycetaceae bacterium]|nr:hypothetical protein [Planctomycetaceae bacterium]